MLMLIFLLSERPLVLNYLNLQPPLEVLLLGVDCYFDAHLRLKIRQCYKYRIISSLDYLS